MKEKLQSPLWDKNISLEAKGLHSAMLHIYGQEPFMWCDIKKVVGDTEPVIKNALVELRDAGYCEQLGHLYCLK